MDHYGLYVLKQYIKERRIRYLIIQSLTRNSHASPITVDVCQKVLRDFGYEYIPDQEVAWITRFIQSL